MTSDNILTADSAVSSGLSVILMVSVVVIVGAVVSVFALGIGESISSPAPSADFDFEILDSGDIRVTHTGGETLNGDNLRFAGAALEKTSFGSITEWRGDITSDDSATVNVEGGETLTVIWQSPESGGTATLAEYDVPDAVSPTASIGDITARADGTSAEITNIQFSRVSGGTVYVVVEKRFTNRVNVGIYESEFSTQGGDLTATGLPTSRRGTTITVWVYETDSKLTEIATTNCSSGRRTPICR